MMEKTILVSFGASRRAVTLPHSGEPECSERELLLATCRLEFHDLLPANLDTCTLVLQTRDEEWGGIFVDYTKPFVDDRSRISTYCITMHDRYTVYSSVCTVKISFAILCRQGWSTVQLAPMTALTMSVLQRCLVALPQCQCLG